MWGNNARARQEHYSECRKKALYDRVQLPKPHRQGSISLGRATRRYQHAEFVEGHREHQREHLDETFPLAGEKESSNHDGEQEWREAQQDRHA